ncbi:MAG: acyltransferase family protein [Cellvibrio sp.]
MQFRKDINGLRAFAVLAVVLFHFNIAGFDGGFSGVDMFFVISGYLMTRIIFTKLDKNSFSILEFYLARAKRIIPALFVVCIFLLIIGWFFLPPSEFKVLGKQTVGASTFLSNFIFLKGAGYFDSASHEKWLLHTWSLSVEWQFYIIYPVVIVAISKFLSQAYCRWFVLGTAVLSFTLSVLLPPAFSAFEFYMLPTRAWEMMAGGLVYLFAPKTVPKFSVALECLGVVIIAASIVFLDASLQWPGVYAIIPVVGVVLVILANRDSSILTGNAIGQYLGAVSYSLYLWHWPIVVAMHVYDVFENNWFKFIGIVLSLMLAHLSYRFVESPWRSAVTPEKKQLLKNPPTLLVLGRYGLATFIVAIAGFAIVKFDGVGSRVDQFVFVADAEQENRNPRVECFVTPSANPKSPMCVFGKNKETISAVVIGDSHANATITAIAESLPGDQGGVLFLGADGCAAMMNLSTPNFYNCGTYNKTILKYLDENLSGVPVIIVNHITTRSLRPAPNAKRLIYLDNVSSLDEGFSNTFSEQYKARVCEIAKKRPVYIMQPIPEMSASVPQAIARAKMLRDKEIEMSVSTDSYFEDTALVRQMIERSADFCKVKIVDPVDYLCSGGKCLGSINGRPLYYDDDHLSEYGNKLLVPMFRKIWDDTGYHLLYQGATAKN